MSQRASVIFKGTILASAIFGMVACGNGSNNGGNNNTGGTIDAGTGTGNAQADTQSTVAAVQTNTQIGVTQAIAASGSALKFVAISQTGACAGGGTFAYSGSVTPGSPSASYDLDFDFEGCDKYDGSVSVVGQYAAGTNAFNYDYTVDGDVGGNGCVVNFDAFALGVDLGISLPPTGNVQLDGAVTGDCGTAGSATCNYNGVDIDITNGTATGAPSCS